MCDSRTTGGYAGQAVTIGLMAVNPAGWAAVAGRGKFAGCGGLAGVSRDDNFESAAIGFNGTREPTASLAG